MSSFTIVYFLRVAGASGFGLGTQADPYRVLSGSAGDAQIQAFLDTIEDLQGSRPTSQEIGMSRTVSLGSVSQNYLLKGGTVSSPVLATGSVRFSVRKPDGTVVPTGLEVALTNQRSNAGAPQSDYAGSAGDVVLAEVISMTPDPAGLRAAVSLQAVVTPP